MSKLSSRQETGDSLPRQRGRGAESGRGLQASGSGCGWHCLLTQLPATPSQTQQIHHAGAPGLHRPTLRTEVAKLLFCA